METAAPSPKKTGSSRLSASARTGAIALVFLIIGFEAALFIHRAAVTALVAHRDAPDTVYVREISPRAPLGRDDSEGAPIGRDDSSVISSEVEKSLIVERHSPQRSAQTIRTRDRYSPRRVENFRFDPNTATLDELMRLGFSEKQAQAIDNYRAKGGRYRRKADFAKSFVVADSVYRRLERYIDIPRLDLNRADSAALDDLPGIGPWFATKILEYRTELGGYSFPEQLLDIYHFDQEKYDGLSDLVFCSPPAPYALWSLPADSLRLHPYIRSRQAARSIVLFRDNTPRDGWTVEALGAAGILPPEDASRLARCLIAPP